MKWKLIMPVLIFSALCVLEAQTSRPSLEIRGFSGGADQDGRNIAAILAVQDAVKNYFTLDEENAAYIVSGEIRREGLGYTVVFVITRGSTVLGSETIWYRDFIELAAYMPAIADSLAGKAIPRIAVRDQLELPQYTGPSPLEIVMPVIRPIDPHPPQPEIIQAELHQPVIQRQLPPIAQTHPSSGEWRNKWFYSGLGFGVQSYSQKIESEWWNGMNDHDGTGGSFGIVADFALTRFASLGLKLLVGKGEVLVPMMVKIGGKFTNVELTGNLGYAGGWLGSFIYGATFGYNIGSGILFTELTAIPGSADNEREHSYHNAVNVILGYKIGLRDKR